MDKEEIRELAFQLLSVSFDTEEWSEEVLENSVTEVADQLECLKCIKETRTTFDTTIDLWDLITEVYACNILHDALRG